MTRPMARPADPNSWRSIAREIRREWRQVLTTTTFLFVAMGEVYVIVALWGPRP